MSTVSPVVVKAPGVVLDDDNHIPPVSHRFATSGNTQAPVLHQLVSIVSGKLVAAVPGNTELVLGMVEVINDAQNLPKSTIPVNTDGLGVVFAGSGQRYYFVTLPDNSNPWLDSMVGGSCNIATQNGSNGPGRLDLSTFSPDADRQIILGGRVPIVGNDPGSSAVLVYGTINPANKQFA